MAPMMMVAASMPEVQVDAGAVAVVMVVTPAVARAMQVPTMPIAPMPHLLHGCAFCRPLEIGDCAAHGCRVSRRCQETQHEGTRG